MLLIHGFAEDGEIWSNQVAALKNSFQVIIPDLPGSGQSASVDDMSIEGMAEVIKAILDEEKIISCILAGHSLGGYISLAVAEKYPDQVSSLALVHSSAYADSEEKKANRLKSIEFVKKHGAFEFLKAVVTDLFTETWAARHPETVELQIEKCRLFSDEVIIKYYQAMINRPDRTSVLKNVDKPVTFIIGEHDKAVPFEQSLKQSYLPSIAHIHILRHSAHMGMLEESQLTNNSLLSMI